MSLLKGSLFLKALALVTAIVAYLYIHEDLERAREEKQKPITDQSFRLLKPTAKNLPIKVRLATEPPEGYAILEEGVIAKPASIIVIAPEALLDEGAHAETALIDISDSTKPLTKRIPLESVAGTHLTGEPFMIEVTVPIRKLEPEPETPAPAAAPLA